VLDLPEDGLDEDLALGVELVAAVGGQDAAHEVVKAAASSGAWFFAAIGVRRDDHLDALLAERFDRLVTRAGVLSRVERDLGPPERPPEHGRSFGFPREFVPARRWRRI
jgi:hypothetical protein